MMPCVGWRPDHDQSGAEKLRVSSSTRRCCDETPANVHAREGSLASVNRGVDDRESPQVADLDSEFGSCAPGWRHRGTGLDHSEANVSTRRGSEGIGQY